MRFGRLLASFLFMLALGVVAYAQDATPGSRSKLRGVSMSQDFSYGGLTYTYSLSTSDLVDTPSWNPLKDDPPVALRKALGVATENLQRFVRDADGWEVGHIDLKQMDTEKWIYEIAFECRRKECVRATGSGFIILVKMDGSVVEPEVKPYRQPNK